MEAAHRSAAGLEEPKAAAAGARGAAHTGCLAPGNLHTHPQRRPVGATRDGALECARHHCAVKPRLQAHKTSLSGSLVEDCSALNAGTRAPLQQVARSVFATPAGPCMRAKSATCSALACLMLPCARTTCMLALLSGEPQICQQWVLRCFSKLCGRFWCDKPYSAIDCCLRCCSWYQGQSQQHCSHLSGYRVWGDAISRLCVY